MLGATRSRKNIRRSSGTISERRIRSDFHPPEAYVGIARIVERLFGIRVDHCLLHTDARHREPSRMRRGTAVGIVSQARSSLARLGKITECQNGPRSAGFATAGISPVESRDIRRHRGLLFQSTTEHREGFNELRMA